MKKYWLMSGLFMVSFCTMAQSVARPERSEIRGTPRILHYTRDDFHGDSQFWTMCQDQDGILYFGNNDGALVFDGARWYKVLLPNNSSVRSLFYSSDGTVYAGGFNEFGTIERDAFGDYFYQSLTGQLRTEELNFENVWSIHEAQEHVVFRSFNKLIAMSDNKAFTIPVTNCYTSTVIDDQLLLVDAQGMKALDLVSLDFSLLIPSELVNQSISAVLPGFREKQLLVITKPGNAFLYDSNTQKAQFFKRFLNPESGNQILSAIKTTGGNYFLGTLSTQIIILDQNGEVVSVNEPSLMLQDNTVLNLFESNEGNIWALLNNGIDCINVTSPVSTLYENASIFDVLIHGGRIYGATNQGVIVSERIIQNPDFSSLSFRKLPGLEGQTWTLQNFQDKIICSHDRGIFVVSEKGVTRVEGLSGVWKVIPIADKPNHYLACKYNGMSMIEYTPEAGFQKLYDIEGFDESSRDIIQGEEPGVFWVCHGYKGVFRLKMDKDYKRVVGLEHYRESGLPSPFSINVFRWQGELVFTTNGGIYSYNPESNTFEAHHTLNELMGTDLNVRKLLQYEDKTWFIHDDELGFFRQGQDQTLEKGLFLELKGTFNRGMECIMPVNSQNVLVGTTSGLFAYNLAFEESGTYRETLITGVSYQMNAERILCALNSSPARLSVKTSGLRFEFSAPRLKDQTRIQYTYKLDGMDEAWSVWTSEPFKEYTQLYPGKYTFRVRSRSLLGETASETAYAFVILPVWYQTTHAYVLYVTILMLGLFVSRKLVRKKIHREKDKTRSEEKKKQKVLELEIQQMRLEREKERIEKDKELLEEDVIHKSKELANYTMLLARKRELLTELRDELTEFKPLTKNEKSRSMIRQLIRKIGMHLSDEEHLQVFQTNFERVHHEFFNELKAQYPDLTTKELQLCALVKMNLTNKEIAPILNISIRGVETARYRLRKRLSINDNMVEFLEKLAQH